MGLVNKPIVGLDGVVINKLRDDIFKVKMVVLSCGDSLLVKFKTAITCYSSLVS